MRTIGWTYLLAAGGLCVAGGIAACGGDNNNSSGGNGFGNATGNGSNGGTSNGGSDGGGTGGGGTNGGASGSGDMYPKELSDIGVTGPSCDGDCSIGDSECAPTADECYVSGNKDIGDECLSQRDNSKANSPDRMQFKLTWAKSTKPLGNTSSTVYGVLANGAGLPWETCNVLNGDIGFTGGFTQLLDIDLAKGISKTGYTPHISPDELQGVLSDGLCMVEDTFTDEAYDLGPDDMSPSDDYPEGLPPPMPRATTPWKVEPTVAKRVDDDFDISDDATRTKYLKEIADDDSISGIFYLNEETGYSHGYAPVAWVVVYTTEANMISIPIREAETFYQVNDPNERSCIGAYRADAMTTAGNCTSTDPNDPPWGCANDSCPGEAPGLVKGYFLTTELEQVYSTVLQSTLCISYPGTDAQGNSIAAADGFPDSDCRSSDKWDPSAADQSGLPSGDWCAATNSKATDSCHDAFQSVTFQTYQGFTVRDDTCGYDGP